MQTYMVLDASGTCLSLKYLKREMTKSAREAHIIGLAGLARSGAKSTLLPFESVMIDSESNKGGQFDRNKGNMTARELLETLDDDV